MSRLSGRWLAHPWGRQRVWEAGDGPVVLAIHGLGGSGRYFERLAEHAAGHFHLVAPDLAGFGASDKPDIPYDRRGRLENLDAVVGDVDEPIVAIGHSLGGVFAALWTARDPSRIAAAAILCAPFPSADGSQVWIQEPEPPRAARIAAPALRTIVRALAVPVGMVRGYPAAVAADYARQTFRSRAARCGRRCTTPRSRRISSASGRSMAGCRSSSSTRRAIGRCGSTRTRSGWISCRAPITGSSPAGHQAQLQDGFAQLASWIGNAAG